MGCRHCGVQLDIQRSRRTPLYCSGSCRTAACRARQRQVPAAMRARDRWVSWVLADRGAGPTRVPIRPDGSPASSTDPATWSPFAAVSRLERKGFVLGDGIACIDLDDCLVDGVPTPAAAAFLAQLPPTYREISPSGEGVHVFGLAPEGPGRRQVVDGLFVETYSVGRYMSFTGQAFGDSVPTLADLTAFIAA